MTSPACPTTASGIPTDQRSSRLPMSEQATRTPPQARAMTPSDKQVQASVPDFSAGGVDGCSRLDEGRGDGACHDGACEWAEWIVTASAGALSVGAVCL